MLIFLRVLRESFYFAINALVNNKLRTILSLLGVTIGIFSIIAVLAAVDSLEREIKSSLSSLDGTTMIITRFSFGPTDIPQWKREQFPDVSYDEYEYLKRSLPDAEALSFVLNVPSENVRYGDRTANQVGIGAVTHEYYDIESLQLDNGRFFSESEDIRGANVVVLGHEIAQILFDGADPVGKQVRMYGQRFTVIGKIKEMGSGMFGGSHDENVFLPTNVVRNIYGGSNRGTFPQIVVLPKAGVDQNEFMATASQALRNYRGLKPDATQDFFINQLSGLTDFIDNMTSQLNFIGMIISGFSLLVGGFGIANIMFVSVKERTNLIGIQKSLGAKNKFILFQFLFEAVILSLIGGLIGLIFVWGISAMLSQFTGDFEFVLSMKNMFIGSSISVLIGLISGIIPAISASRLDPVEAIRTGM